ncbi:uncharacterized protein LOC123448472 [Hordeum vulgare subsp. vulgare]|uniref:uncharacterized protein LOC123448472 n=1 Tax=Hordeum vulgare subsp. vulgare TaxID=112509 RepID=UPI00162EC4A0|nr:uncharacterized protein LOC123448472 [Hordeum vulgare subsp. vulgare]XP_044981323.1 uncharacterized protein LOC123448472 [Hordeum vulgare subsp. vulgare]
MLEHALGHDMAAYGAWCMWRRSWMPCPGMRLRRLGSRRLHPLPTRLGEGGRLGAVVLRPPFGGGGVHVGRRVAVADRDEADLGEDLLIGHEAHDGDAVGKERGDARDGQVDDGRGLLGVALWEVVDGGADGRHGTHAHRAGQPELRVDGRGLSSLPAGHDRSVKVSILPSPLTTPDKGMRMSWARRLLVVLAR